MGMSSINLIKIRDTGTLVYFHKLNISYILIYTFLSIAYYPYLPKTNNSM